MRDSGKREVSDTNIHDLQDWGLRQERDALKVEADRLEKLTGNEKTVHRLPSFFT